MLMPCGDRRRLLQALTPVMHVHKTSTDAHLCSQRCEGWTAWCKGPVGFTRGSLACLTQACSSKLCMSGRESLQLSSGQKGKSIAVAPAASGLHNLHQPGELPRWLFILWQACSNGAVQHDDKIILSLLVCLAPQCMMQIN